MKSFADLLKSFHDFLPVRFGNTDTVKSIRTVPDRCTSKTSSIEKGEITHTYTPLVKKVKI